VAKTTDTAILILAAGASTRLGRPKQLVKMNGETLLHRIARRAAASTASQVLVVLGYQAETIPELSDLPNVSTIHNPEWQNGIGTSIRAGARELASSDAILISVCDQPYLTTDIFDELIQKLPLSPTGIVCSRYLSADSSDDRSLSTLDSPLSTPYGVPAIFASQHFPALLTLRDDAGAKSLITANDVEFIDFPLGAVDIDTADDLREF
jgi:molybdenum cofactor cytidylyltransferase